MAANLGEASTRELLEELRARLTTQDGVGDLVICVEDILDGLDDEMLAYRTVDS